MESEILKAIINQVLTCSMYETAPCVVCRITFIAVSDPEDQDTDCEELGAASVDLNMVYMLMMVVVLLHYYCIDNCRC